MPAFNLNGEDGRADLSRLLVRIAERDWEDGLDYMLTSLAKPTNVIGAWASTRRS